MFTTYLEDRREQREMIKMINKVATAISTIYNEMTACGVKLSFQVVRVHTLSLTLFLPAGWGTNDTERPVT